MLDSMDKTSQFKVGCLFLASKIIFEPPIYPKFHENMELSILLPETKFKLNFTPENTFEELMCFRTKPTHTPQFPDSW